MDDQGWEPTEPVPSPPPPPGTAAAALGAAPALLWVHQAPHGKATSPRVTNCPTARCDSSQG